MFSQFKGSTGGWNGTKGETQVDGAKHGHHVLVTVLGVEHDKVLLSCAELQKTGRNFLRLLVKFAIGQSAVVVWVNLKIIFWLFKIFYGT